MTKFRVTLPSLAIEVWGENDAEALEQFWYVFDQLEQRREDEVEIEAIEEEAR